MNIKGYDDWKLASPDEDYSREDEANAKIDELSEAVDKMDEVLRDCLDYFEARQDAETFSDGTVTTNEEMQLAVAIKAVLK